MTVKRTRGRPPAGDAADRRAAILDAARAKFAAQGFSGTSMRAIAREAGVDVSLISHYFGDKAGLLVATMELPVNPIEKIAGVIEDGPDGMAERLLRTFLTAWDPHRDVFSSMYRTTMSAQDSQAPMLQLAREVLVSTLMEVLEGDDRELRATLIASQLIGMATLRYVVQMPPVADAAIEDVVRLYGPAMQVLIDAAADR
ncbi:TetR family transcriptional regulator [Aeromicrobium ginsengisoli]|uniref:TetR/AcrR family transcriptional regulator n=1 Tax=Aeromicrobium ginsengisoli TaxID=363867 RepID=A0A5M4FAN0_9ACTN|nr:TetR family transcriptional regulator [Aeromicrobium ginsengisoli]KAA1395327.1 TetR/AcrR family transcriptional regulator [Aeromicrobium ginsengisoli]